MGRTVFRERQFWDHPCLSAQEPSLSFRPAAPAATPAGALSRPPSEQCPQERAEDRRGAGGGRDALLTLPPAEPREPSPTQTWPTAGPWACLPCPTGTERGPGTSALGPRLSPRAPPPPAPQTQARPVPGRLAPRPKGPRRPPRLTCAQVSVQVSGKRPLVPVRGPKGPACGLRASPAAPRSDPGWLRADGRRLALPGPACVPPRLLGQGSQVTCSDLSQREER